MKKVILLALLAVGFTNATADVLTQVALIDNTNHTLSGTFGKYDFVNVESAFDWVFTTADGVSYQLKGKEPSDTDAFGWKAVDITAPTPKWYMFSIDIDGDGKISKFEWVLLSADAEDKAAYKLAGANDNGTFKYSNKLNIDYKISDTAITTGVSGAFNTASDLTLRIYVAGESVEEFNHMNSLPFNSDGSLNGTSNTHDEYGWMVPFEQRLLLRDSNLHVEWIGSSCWTDQNTWDCSTGAYTNETVGHTSAQAGSTVEIWQNDHNSELSDKEYCYDIAFASRGGNDLDHDIPEATYEVQLRQLVINLEQGSNCRTHPIIYVTSHILDSSAWNYNYTQNDIDAWMTKQRTYYVDIAKRVANNLNTDGRIVRFVDMWTPFYDDSTTTAFPSETWWITNGNGVKMPDLAKIHWDESQHPSRLSSIFAGEVVADQIDIAEVRQIISE